MNRICTWLAAPLLLLACLAWSARADQGDPVPVDERVKELRLRVRNDGGARAEQGANDLFVMADTDQDQFLLATLSDGKPDGTQARLAILRALRMCGRHRPDVACAMAYPALADPVQAVADQARETFGTFEDDLNRPFEFMRKKLLDKDTQRARQDTQRARQALALVEVLERHMRNQIEATSVLVDVLESYPGSVLEARVRQALQTMTSCSFQDVRAWRRWFDATRQRCGGSLTIWRAEINALHVRQLSRYEDEALEIFRRLLERLAQAPDAEALILQQLLDTLKRESVPKVRQLAIQRLGDLAGKRNQGAVAELRARLKNGGDDAPQAILELARAEDPALLEDVLPWIGERHPVPMRLAAVAALSRLKAPGAVDPLLELLAPRTVDEVREAAVSSLGKIGLNPEGKVSRALVGLAAGLLAPAGSPGTTPPALVKLVAEALSLIPLAGPDAQAALALLQRLAGGEVDDANVRYYAVTALGRQEPEEGFQVLLKRSEPGQEQAVRVRAAILDALTQQALEHSERRAPAIRRLVAFVEDPEPILLEQSRRNLERLTDPRVDPTLAVRRLVASELSAVKKVGWEALAARLLESLPEKPGELAGQALEDWKWLLQVRAEGRLQNGERQGALGDLQQLLGQGRAQVAFELGLRCLPPLSGSPPTPAADPLATQAWKLVLDALEAQKGEPERLKELLNRLAPYQDGVPQTLRQRLDALRTS